MRPLTSLAILFALSPICAQRAVADDAAEQLAAASALIDAKKYSEAAQKLTAFVAAFPKHERIGAASLALGRCRAELKQYAQAIPAYEKAIASGDANIIPSAYLGIGESAINSGQFEKAVASLNEAVKADLARSQVGIAYLWLGQANFRLSRFIDSEAAYERVVKDFPTADYVDSAWFGAGLSSQRLGKTEVARARFRTVLAKFPKSEDRPRAMIALAQLDTDAKRFPEARSQYEAVLQDPVAKRIGGEVMESAENGLIHVLLEIGDVTAASSRLEAALTRLPPADPQRFRAQLSLGHCRYRQKQYDQALSAYQEAGKSTELAVAGEGLYWAGNVLLAQDKKVEAGTQFKLVAARYAGHPLAAKALMKSGDSYAAGGKPDLAGVSYRLLVAKYPGSDLVQEARKAINDLAGSITDPVQLATSLKAMPAAERGPGLVRLARILMEAKKYAEMTAPLTELQAGPAAPDLKGEGKYLEGLAAELNTTPLPKTSGGSSPNRSAIAASAFARAVALAPNAPWSAHAQVRLAWLQLQFAQPGKAEAAANAAIALKPADDLLQEARLARIQSLLDQKKWEDALAGCDELLKSNPAQETVATVIYTQAWVGQSRNKPDEALPFWEKLAADHPKSPYTAEAQVRIGDARYKADKPDEARERFAAVVEGFASSPFRAEARFKLGSSLYLLMRPQEAAVEFDAVATDKTAGDYIPEALYWAGVAYDKFGKKDIAIQRFTRLVSEFPKHARVSTAKVRLAALKAG